MCFRKINNLISGLRLWTAWIRYVYEKRKDWDELSDFLLGDRR